MFSIVLIVSLLHSGDGNQYTYSSRLSITKEKRVTLRVRLKRTRKRMETKIHTNGVWDDYHTSKKRMDECHSAWNEGRLSSASFVVC